MVNIFIYSLHTFIPEWLTFFSITMPVYFVLFFRRQEQLLDKAAIFLLRIRAAPAVSAAA